MFSLSVLTWQTSTLLFVSSQDFSLWGFLWVSLLFTVSAFSADLPGTPIFPLFYAIFNIWSSFSHPESSFSFSFIFSIISSVGSSNSLIHFFFKFILPFIPLTVLFTLALVLELTFLLGILLISYLCFLWLIFPPHIFMLILHFWKVCFSSSASGVVLYVDFLHSNYILKSSSFGLWSHVSLRLSISHLVRCVGERGHVPGSVFMDSRRGEQISLRAESPRSLESHNWSSTSDLRGELAWGEGGSCGLCLVWVWERGWRADPTHFHQLF